MIWPFLFEYNVSYPLQLLAQSVRLVYRITEEDGSSYNRKVQQVPRIYSKKEPSQWRIPQPGNSGKCQRDIWSSESTLTRISKLLAISPKDLILDLCCGIGRHSLELARRGYRVTGVDRTIGYLDKARRQAKEEGLDIEFVQGDMRLFSRPVTFDIVISMFTSFSYFEDPKEDEHVVENVFLSLRPGGRFIIQMRSKETLAKVFRERDWNENKDDGVIVLEERKVSQNWNWMENRWIMLRGSERIENVISHRLYAGSEIATLLHDCGFNKVDVYGDLEGNPYDHTARQLVVVGYK